MNRNTNFVQQGVQEQYLREEKKSKGKKIAVAVIIILLLLVIGLLIFMLLEKDRPVVEKGEPVKEKVVAEVESGRTAIPVVSDFAVTKENPDVSVYNPKANEGKSYLSYEFINKDSGEVIYKTDLIEAGSSIPIPFGTLLEAGEYNVKLNTYSFDYKNPRQSKNGSSSDIVVTVKE